jgi:Bacterial protein of unknown function (DUF899)
MVRGERPNSCGRTWPRRRDIGTNDRSRARDLHSWRWFCLTIQVAPSSQLSGRNNNLERTKIEIAPGKGRLPVNTPPVVSAEDWEAARQRLLVKEKDLTHARDALAAERRRMPWLAVEKAYQFDGPRGRASLLDLFEGRHQLIVYRTCLPRLFHGGRPGRAPRPSERARHHARVRLARATA